MSQACFMVVQSLREPMITPARGVRGCVLSIATLSRGGLAVCSVLCKVPGRPRGHQISRRSYRAGRSRVKDGQRSQPPAFAAACP